jgi:uncharacterized protein (TIGR00725 family)
VQPTIAVIGAGQASAEEERLATEVGRQLAEAGAVVVCGGLGGVMGAVAEGVAAAGGTCVGLLPGSDRADGHPALTLALPTGMGEGRNLLVVRAADAVIAIGGGYGTLSEIGFARKLGRAVVGLGTWSVRQDGEDGTDHVVAVEDTAEAVRLAMAACS